MKFLLKNYYQKIIFLLITSTVSLHGMETIMNWSEKVKDRLTLKFYTTGTATIDYTAEAITGFAAWYIHTMHQKNNYPIDYKAYEHATQTRIKCIHNSLLIEEQVIINDMYDHLDLSEVKKKEINEQVRQEKEFAKEYMRHAHDGIIHAINISDDLSENIQRVTGINIKSINICRDDTQDNAVASAKGLIRSSYTNVITSPAIYIRPIFFQLSPTGQAAILLHEIGHIAAGHSITNYFLDKQLEKPLSKKLIEALLSGTLHAFKDEYINKIKKLKINSEQQAEILFKDAQGTEFMRKLRKHGYYANTLFFNHYAQLTEIDELHKFPEKLKNNKLVPIQKIPDVSKMKFAYEREKYF